MAVNTQTVLFGRPLTPQKQPFLMLVLLPVLLQVRQQLLQLLQKLALLTQRQ
jgi:hypothetical protein